jgi:divalent metal cation (Fe/Co/Zn/Cd) transporter
VQRVGAFIVGTVFVGGGLTAIWLSLAVKGKFQTEISSPLIAWAASLFSVAWALAIASFAFWLGGRLLAVCFRHSPIRKGRT